MEIPIRNTIFLQGVFFSQVMTLEDRMLEENIAQHDRIDDAPSERRVTNVRITRFKNKKQWAEAYKDATIKCWLCGSGFKGIPCFIPKQIRNTPTGKEYETHGLFCGFACAYTFLKTQSEFVKNKSFVDKLSMLKMLFTLFYNKKINEFKEAPYLYDLTSYGGHIDIVDYRNQLRNINAAMLGDASFINL